MAGRSVPESGVAGAPGGVHARAVQVGMSGVWCDGCQAQNVLVSRSEYCSPECQRRAWPDHKVVYSFIQRGGA